MGASSGGFPIDLILFGMIAAFLVLRLRSILGKRQGFERPPEAAPRPDLRVVDDTAAHPPPPAAPERALPDPASPLGRTLAAMQSIDGDFTPGRFLDGAEQAFRMIVTAFAAGDRAALRPLLSSDTYAAFDGAIAAREAAGETQRTEIRDIQDASIEAAELRGGHASITVHFTSDQVNLTLDRDGRETAGTDAVTEIRDIWTFERDLGTPDPTWRLVAARSA
ncbi:MAG: Tim44 domain-containing protein [Acetobacteraceae bacterium]|nr:Tim44 domain-containing protein [Acetobacteraceae bacterium]